MKSVTLGEGRRDARENGLLGACASLRRVVDLLPGEYLFAARSPWGSEAGGWITVQPTGAGDSSAPKQFGFKEK